MGLYFKNGTGDTLFVAYAYHAPGCEGGTDWSKKGWYRIAPGGTTKVSSGWAGPGKYFVFAENELRTRAWSGPFFTQLPSGHSTGAGKQVVRTAALLVLPNSRWGGEFWITLSA